MADTVTKVSVVVMVGTGTCVSSFARNVVYSGLFQMSLSRT